MVYGVKREHPYPIRAQESRLLMVLREHVGEWVHADRLSPIMWPDRPAPEHPHKTLKVYACTLRSNGHQIMTSRKHGVKLLKDAEANNAQGKEAGHP
jgi:DNA-binding winged helix-turn-helix (wHTH) protein